MIGFVNTFYDPSSFKVIFGLGSMLLTFLQNLKLLFLHWADCIRKYSVSAHFPEIRFPENLDPSQNMNIHTLQFQSSLLLKSVLLGKSA